MSRSGYTDNCKNPDLYRNTVHNAIVGKRGQKFLRELIVALDAIPTRRLISYAMERDGEVCALQSVGKLRGVNLNEYDHPYEEYVDIEEVATALQIPQSLAREIMYYNDEGSWAIETPEQRWTRMREWAVENLISR